MTETMVSPAESSYEERVVAAAREWIARRSGLSAPVGKSTPKGYWYPDDALERQPCCRTHVPRREFPQAMRKHALGAKHVAVMFDVAERDLKRAAAALSG